MTILLGTENSLEDAVGWKASKSFMIREQYNGAGSLYLSPSGL